MPRVKTTTTVTRTVSVSTTPERKSKKISKSKKTSKTTPRKTTSTPRLNLKPQNLTVEQIKDMLRSHRASVTGDKDELVARLRREIHKASSFRTFLSKLTCESLKDLLDAHNESCSGAKHELVSRATNVVSR